MNKSIHDRIRERRIELGLSQDQLAAKMGYKSRSSINKIESGQADIARNKLEQLAEALLTTPAYLMGWEEPKSKQSPDFQPVSTEPAPTNTAVDNIGIMKSNSPLQFVVADNSFFPTISMNDTVSVDTLRQANPNKSILAVQATGASGEILGPYVVLRFFFYTPTGIVIYSPSPQFQQVFYSYQYLKDAHPIIGVVTAIMFNQENI